MRHRNSEQPITIKQDGDRLVGTDREIVQVAGGTPDAPRVLAPPEF